MHVENKKIHHSQRLVSRNDDGSIEIELLVVVNYELISAILGFGVAVMVLYPERLVLKLQEEISDSNNLYSVNQGDQEQNS